MNLLIEICDTRDCTQPSEAKTLDNYRAQTLVSTEDETSGFGKQACSAIVQDQFIPIIVYFDRNLS